MLYSNDSTRSALASLVAVSFQNVPAGGHEWNQLGNDCVECRWGRQKSRFWANIWLHCVLWSSERYRCELHEATTVQQVDHTSRWRQLQLNCCPANKLGGLAKAGGPGLVTAGGDWTKTGLAWAPRPHSWLRPWLCQRRRRTCSVLPTATVLHASCPVLVVMVTERAESCRTSLSSYLKYKNTVWPMPL